MRIRNWSIVAIVMLVAAGTAFAANNLWVGTWKMDAAQSKLTGDTIHFAKSALLIIERYGDEGNAKHINHGVIIPNGRIRQERRLLLPAECCSR